PDRSAELVQNTQIVHPRAGRHYDCVVVLNPFWGPDPHMVETVLHIQYALEGSHPRPLCLSDLNCGKDGRTRPQDAPLRIEEDRLVLIDSEAESLRGLTRLNALE